MTAIRSSLVVLDLGTSTVRAALFREGRLSAHARRSVDIAFPRPGHAEQDPRELWDAAREVLEETCSALSEGEPAALGITNQRSTVVAWDAESDRPFGPALSWRDSRATAQAEALAAAVPDLSRRTGLPPSPHYGAPKLAWMLAHWPAAKAAAAEGRLRVGPLSTWITWRLSRGAAFTIDPTNAQRMLLLDLARLEWDRELLAAAGLHEAALPKVLPTDGHFGDAHVAGRVLPIRTILGDQQAALLGLAAGASTAGGAGVQLGTGGFVLKDVGSECRHVPGLLAGLARADANKPRRYLVEGTVNAAGSALDRLKDLGVLREGEDIDVLCGAASAPVTVVPAWGGLGAPWWNPRARASIAGLAESSTRADVVLGTVHGIAFLIADVIDAMAAAGLEVGSLELSGPVSRIACVARSIADATQRTLHVRTNPEASLEGIAVALAEACESVAPRLSVEVGRRFEPSQDLSGERTAFARARDAALLRDR